MNRYPEIENCNYCYHPKFINKDGKQLLVPCGKCDGCLVHKSNIWSQRIGNEIDNNPFSIFFTLTYNNKYLPKLFPIFGNGLRDNSDSNVCMWISDHPQNIRFNGKEDVFRKDNIIINYPYEPSLVQNFDDYPAINYASKRDIQLWLKMLRKDTQESLYGQSNDGSKTEPTNYFRYYIISEVGPSTHRNHFHGIIFPCTLEIAEYLSQCGLFKNWQMCDKVLFDTYTHYCDSGARNYVSNYVTRYSDIPRVYREVKELQPFRLSSKCPSIGSGGFDIEKIFEDVSVGVIQYDKEIKRLSERSLVSYPSHYLRAIFPKCKGYSTLSFDRLLIIYGYLWSAVSRYGVEYISVSSGLRQAIDPMDYNASLCCYRYCKRLNIVPFHYLFCLDMYYYKCSMEQLKYFYQEQEKQSHFGFSLSYLSNYSNVNDYVRDSLPYSQQIVATLFFASFGFSYDSLSTEHYHFKSLSVSDGYKHEIDDIKSNMVKMPKYNEMTGNSPHIV